MATNGNSEADANDAVIGMEVEPNEEEVANQNDGLLPSDAVEEPVANTGESGNASISNMTIEMKEAFNVYKASWEGGAAVGSPEFCEALAQTLIALEELGSGDAGRQQGSSLGPTPAHFGGGGGGGPGYPGGNGGRPGDNGSPKSTLTFSDCGGLEKQVGYIKSAILDPLGGKNSSGLARFGLEPPKGVLFFGPPGTGKTRLAQALSNEITKVLGTKVHFIYRKGKDVASKYFGQSSQNLRRVFDEAIANQPTVLFFDELDGLCPSRDNPHQCQANVTIVTTMLGMMDELPRGKVFVVGATNRLEAVDPALRRPGRFDKHLEFLPPSQPGRHEILKIHTKVWKKRPDSNVLRRLSQQTVGFSGADLAKLCLDAFDHALTRLLGGATLRNLNSVDFNRLDVEEKDWKLALSKMKATNSAVFGSNLYNPGSGVGDHAASLLENNRNTIVKHVTDLLPPTKSYSENSAIRSLHVVAHSDSILEHNDEYLISEVLRSQELGQYAVYCINSSTISSVPVTQWAATINSAFTQALESPQSAILYVQEVDELWELLKGGKLGYGLNIKAEVERLRGKFVLLLTTGSCSPSLLPADNPFKQVLGAGALSKSHQVIPPSAEARKEFLFQLFATVVLSTEQKWTTKQLNMLEDTLDKAVENTEGHHVGSVILLYDRLQQNLLTVKHASVQHTLVAIMEIVAFHQNMGFNQKSKKNENNGKK